MKNLLMLAVAGVLLTGCAGGSSSESGKGELSPSGRFFYTVEEAVNPANETVHFLQVVINDFEGQEIYRDINSEFSSYYGMNTAWEDDADRVWAYYLDDKSVYFWQLENNHWQKRKWGTDRKTFVFDHLSPPESIYP